MEIDLDKERAARAAEAEAKGLANMVRVGGKTFRLPPAQPFGFGEQLDAAKTDEDARAIFRRLLGPEQSEEFFSLDFDYDDLVLIISRLQQAWGLVPGEAPASNGSSANGSSRSRPTSKGSTGSTSRKRAGAKKP